MNKRMTQILYHGGKYTTYLDLIQKGFDLSKIGSGFGTTLGKGIYLTKSPAEAAGYAADKKTIIEVSVEGLKTYKLDRAYSVDSAKQRRKLGKIIEQAKRDGFNSLESVDGLEIVIWPEYANLIHWDCADIIKYNKESEMPEEEKCESEDESDEENVVVYMYHYICNHCGIEVSDPDPDCSSCGKEFCMMAHEIEVVVGK